MISLKRDVTCFPLSKLHNGRWLLNIFLIKADPNESISNEVVFQIVDKHISQIETLYMSNEFDYFRTGFAFLHFGNRGVDLTIWHLGKWGKTFEIFTVSWYCYNRDLITMSVLDHAEPVICQYEMNLMCEQLDFIMDIFYRIDESDDFQRSFSHFWNTTYLQG